MSTRSVTLVHDDDETSPVLVAMYRHSDGNFESHGKDLFNFLKDKTLINGLTIGNETLDVANGMGDLAAQMVCYFKNQSKVGGIYLKDSTNAKEHYVYIIYKKDNQIYLDSSNGNQGYQIVFGNKKKTIEDEGVLTKLNT